jgi:hypothetical protein
MIYSLRNKDVKDALKRLMANPCYSLKPKKVLNSVGK